MSALQNQVGGDHYRSLSYQPYEFCCDVKASPALNHFTKYLVRNKGDRLENLKKALHCIELEEEMVKQGRTFPTGTNYCRINSLVKFCFQFPEGISVKYREAIYYFMIGDYTSCKFYVEGFINENTPS